MVAAGLALCLEMRVLPGVEPCRLGSMEPAMAALVGEVALAQYRQGCSGWVVVVWQSQVSAPTKVNSVI